MGEALERLAHERCDVLGIVSFTESGEVDEVGEQEYGDLALPNLVSGMARPVAPDGCPALLAEGSVGVVGQPA